MLWRGVGLGAGLPGSRSYPGSRCGCWRLGGCGCWVLGVRQDLGSCLLSPESSVGLGARFRL